MTDSGTALTTRSICLEGDLTIQTAAAVWPVLLQQVRECQGDARLDLRQVSNIDTAGIQMLLVIRRLTHAAGTRLVLLQPGTIPRSVLEFCGLGEAIEAGGDDGHGV